MAATTHLKAALFLALLTSRALSLEQPDGAGRLPALGWNSWNAYGCAINASNFLAAADTLVATGLRDAGYTYVNIDDC